MRPTYSTSASVRAGLFSIGLLFTACGSDGNGGITNSSENSTTDDDDKPSTADAGANACTNEGKTTSCSCTNGKSGTKTCKNSKYGQCVCAASTSDAGKPATGKNLCKAGYYTGGFKGTYRPGAFGFGIFASSFQVDIVGGKSFFDDSLPPLAFTLTEDYAGNGEFQTFKVGGGCMQGIANAVVITQSPFVARLDGNLNCSTGEFEGTLAGYYTLIGIPGADFSFKGPLTAQFNSDSQALEDGAWMVSEPPAADGNPAGGGEGTWDAKFTSDDAPIFKNNPCDNVGPNGEHTSIVNDAGQLLPGTTTTGDAGVAQP